MDFPSRPHATFGRRDVLRLAPAVALVAACAPAGDEPDPLGALDRAARADAALARSVSRSHSDLSGTANSVADVRTEHARALRREIDRLNPPDPDAPGPRSPARPPAPGSSDQAVAALRDALRSAQQDAAKLVPGLPPYRAGLAGSISASCAGLLEVLG